jgi:hypothetical protein
MVKKSLVILATGLSFAVFGASRSYAQQCKDNEPYYVGNQSGTEGSGCGTPVLEDVFFRLTPPNPPNPPCNPQSSLCSTEMVLRYKFPGNRQKSP